MVRYALPGSRSYLQQLFPDPHLLAPGTHLDTFEAVIAHFTASSLAEDGIEIVAGSLSVSAEGFGYTVAFDPLPAFAAQAAQFATMHAAMLDAEHAGLALRGADACKLTPLWNPMAGYPVDRNDGPSVWVPCLPLGLGLANHQAVSLMHYPPIVAYRTANYLNNMTLHRWSRLLQRVGIAEPRRYHTIVDVNPIAAPGSGESEYPNDYFSIGLTQQFYDNEQLGLTYVRSMLALMLDPPSNAANAYTLPLLVCGSALYDPQGPGWFRIRFKDHLPTDKNGVPRADLLQAGYVKLHPDSPKKTPYMIANHMITAGVFGRCTDDPMSPNNIQRFEAQDLVAATFLSLIAKATAEGRDLDPADARLAACQRWFGANDGSGVPQPPDPEDRLAICALAQMDLCVDWSVMGPAFTFEQALERCRHKGGIDASPCFGCKPLTAAG